MAVLQKGDAVEMESEVDEEEVEDNDMEEDFHYEMEEPDTMLVKPYLDTFIYILLLPAEYCTYFNLVLYYFRKFLT